LCPGHAASSLTCRECAAGWTATQAEERGPIQRSIAAVSGGKITNSENALRDAPIIHEVKKVVYRIKSHAAAQDGKPREAGAGIDGIRPRRIEIGIHTAEARGSVANPEVADRLICD
jgi:hypothetical protein